MDREDYDRHPAQNYEFSSDGSLEHGDELGNVLERIHQIQFLAKTVLDHVEAVESSPLPTTTRERVYLHNMARATKRYLSLNSYHRIEF